MITTSNPELWDLIWSFKDHGKTWDAVYNHHHPPGFKWVHERFGSNLRLTEMQSAIGRIQLQRMNDSRAARKRNAQQLIDALRDCPVIRVSAPPDHLEHAWYKFYCYVNLEVLADSWNRDRIVAEISAKGFPALQGGCNEIYLEKCFQNAGMAPSSRLPVARLLGETSLMFLVHPTITAEQMTAYAEAIRSVVNKATR